MNPGTARTILLTAMVGLSCAAGCVAPEKLREAENANRVLEEQNRKLATQNEALRAELGQQGARIDDLQAEISRISRINQNLNTSVIKLTRNRDELRKAYEDLLTSQQPPAINITILPPELDKALKQFSAEYPDMIEYEPGRGMIKFKSDLTFDKGSAKPGPEARDALQKFARILESPEASQFMVVIAGHTDNIPIKKPSTRKEHPNNWYLSAHRAISVQYFLTEIADFNAKRVAVMGFGKYHPVQPNKPNQGGNPANRRVEVWLVPPGQFLTETAADISGSDK